jgi:uncharacterized protein (TIGR00255 family)
MKSMTGFGRAEVDAPFGKLVAEVQSVNRKFLEVHVALPKEFAQFEQAVRERVGHVVHRGSVMVRFHLSPNAASVGELLPDVGVLKALKKGWDEIAKSVGAERVDLPFLLEHAAELSVGRAVSEEDFEPFGRALNLALKALEGMRKREGDALTKDIVSRLKGMQRCVSAIEKMAGGAVQKLRQKLKERMEEVLRPGEALDERLLREVAFYAERLDISEEITRFRSHISQSTDLMNEADGSGRKMDFLIQEMGREINTIGSKSMDAKISHLVVEVKSELEKVREQIQNVE